MWYLKWHKRKSYCWENSRSISVSRTLGPSGWTCNAGNIKMNDRFVRRPSGPRSYLLFQCVYKNENIHGIPLKFKQMFHSWSACLLVALCGKTPGPLFTNFIPLTISSREISRPRHIELEFHGSSEMWQALCHWCSWHLQILGISGGPCFTNALFVFVFRAPLTNKD